MIDLTKPIYVGRDDISERFGCSKITKRVWATVNGVEMEWEYPSGKPLGPHPPLTNVPPAEERWYVQMLSDGNKVGPVHNSEPADQKQVVKVAILGPGEPPLSYYASLHSELRIAKANAEADSTRIAALEGMVRELSDELVKHENHELCGLHISYKLMTRAKNLLNGQYMGLPKD